MTRFSSLAEKLAPFGVGDLSLSMDVELNRAYFDSRLIRPGDLFCALPSAGLPGSSGLQYLPQALQAGAVAVLHGSAPLSSSGTTGLLEQQVPEFRVDLQFAVSEVAGLAAHALANHPSEPMWVGAVTGTNGKSTIVHLLQHALDASGVPTAAIGTLGMYFPGCDAPVANTTPSADLMAEWLITANSAGAKALAVEASSHGLDQHRLAGMPIDAAAWTNLSHDHLDYHEILEEYASAKARLIHGLDPGSPAFLPAHDDLISSTCRGTNASVMTWCLMPGGEESSQFTGKPQAAIRGHLRAKTAGIALSIEGVLGRAEIQSKLVGRHNAENLIVAWCLLRSAGIDAETAALALAKVECAPGRLERVAAESGLHLFVDYAHTPDALRQVLCALRDTYPESRIGVVFGAGGDRDAQKRAPMGVAAASGSDWCIVTSDNPRTENPQSIADAVAKGVAEAGVTPQIQVNRRTAIREALSRMAIGDVLLVAGKGHEPYQEIDGVRHHFDDREEVQEAVRSLS